MSNCSLEGGQCHLSVNIRKNRAKFLIPWNTWWPCVHTSNKGEQLVQCYGFYRNILRGKWRKRKQDYLVPSILNPNGSSKAYCKNWAWLILKIYGVDPLTCPKCQGDMRIISFLNDRDVIKKILKHMDLWDLSQV